MTKILEILREFLKEVEKNNPYRLVLKGGTALSIYYLNHHRESEDLDFDADEQLRKQYKNIEQYFFTILETLKKRKSIQEYVMQKSGFAATNRYHISLELKTHKSFRSKIDVDFVYLPKNLIKKGELQLYLPERLFVTKALTFISREEFKDVYDLAHLLPKVDITAFQKRARLITVIEKVIHIMEQEDLQQMYKVAFRNVDLRFKTVNASTINVFTKKTIQKLRILVNKLKR